MDSTFSDAFQTATARHAAWAGEQLDTFNAYLPGGEWSADLDRRLFRQGGREVRVSLLGSFSERDSSWLWAWANPGFKGTPVTGAAEAVSRFGSRFDVPELTGEGVDLSGSPDPGWAVERLVFGAMGVLGAPGYIGVRANADSRVYLVPDDPRVPRATPDPVTLPRVLMDGVALAGGPARPVVHGYFAHHGLPVHEDPGSLAARLADGTVARVEFDAWDDRLGRGAHRGRRRAVTSPGPGVVARSRRPGAVPAGPGGVRPARRAAAPRRSARSAPER